MLLPLQEGQDAVYQETAHGLVNGVLDGFNASVFAYGATGAGKTYTMLGAIDQPGVMVNTLYDMFTRMQTDEEFADKKFKVTLSYLEIYNELIKDLLLPSSVDLKLHEDPVRGMVVQGITEYGADSADEILELLHRGNLHRSVEPTAANQVSSRSHAVLQVRGSGAGG
jgi:kinesin family protein 18/19